MTPAFPATGPKSPAWHRVRQLLSLLLLVAGLALIAPTAYWTVLKWRVLMPPTGYSAAVIVFEDLQCPDCARAAPVISEASKLYHAPVIRYDFPLPKHTWALQAAVLARHFGRQSPLAGVQFREWILQHQTEINPGNVRDVAVRFAREHHMAETLPAADDPSLSREVQADIRLGKRLGVSHTPTVFVVSNQTAPQEMVEAVASLELMSALEAATATKK